MARRNKRWTELEALRQPFLPAEGTGDVTIELRDRLSTLEQQVLAQFTAMAAYTTIAEQRSETLRAEARANVDRSHAVLVGLLDKLRRELPASTASPAIGDAAARISSLEVAVTDLAAHLVDLQRENGDLRGRLRPNATDASSRWASLDAEGAILTIH